MFSSNNFAHDEPGLGGSNTGVGSGGGNTPFGSIPAGIPNFLASLFQRSGRPFQQASNAYFPWLNKATDAQNPFYNAGTGAVGNLQDWLSKMKDPGQFTNNLMQQYQGSPYQTYLQNQAQRAGTNAASASGLTGSTPFAQQLQQNASNISQGGMNDWMNQALGINSQYGAGQAGLAGMGQHASDVLSNLFSGQGQGLAQLQALLKQGQNQDTSNIFGGILHMFSNGLFG